VSSSADTVSLPGQPGLGRGSRCNCAIADAAAARRVSVNAPSADQLSELCRAGYIAVFEPQPILAEGDPASCLYVLVDGELVMSNDPAATDVETTRTSQRAAFCGA
jgi:hypothetical protein